MSQLCQVLGALKSVDLKDVEAELRSSHEEV